jgi:hypothetical protein
LRPPPCHAPSLPRLRRDTDTYPASRTAVKTGVIGYGHTGGGTATHGTAGRPAAIHGLRPAQQRPDEACHRRSLLVVELARALQSHRLPDQIVDGPRGTEPSRPETQAQWEDMRKVWGRLDRTVRASVGRHLSFGMFYLSCKAPKFFCGLGRGFDGGRGASSGCGCE